MGKGVVTREDTASGIGEYYVAPPGAPRNVRVSISVDGSNHRMIKDFLPMDNQCMGHISEQPSLICLQPFPYKTLWNGFLCCLSLIVTFSATASAKDLRTMPIPTTICEVSADPAFFDGKVVSLKATVISAFEVFAIGSQEQDCGRMWLEYSEGGPPASTSLTVSRKPRVPITVLKDKNFKRFQSLLNAAMYPRTHEHVCIDCHRYQVSAEMVGRVDYAGSQAGYGHMNAYKLQFELISVLQVNGKDLISRYDPEEFSPDPVRLPNGYIEGRLISPDGKRYEDIWVTATHADTENEFQSVGDADTDKKGNFKISVPPGEYVVGVNVIRPASESFPFRTTYAPSASTFKSAQIYKVVDGQTVRADIFLTPPLSPRSIP